MKVLIVGFGYAGKRFLRVFQSISNTSPNLCIELAFCDSSYEIEVPITASLFSDFESALQQFKPDVVVVTVNETSHFPILEKLQDYDCTILCEKPLTETLEQAQALDWLRNKHLFINLVERFSPIATSLRRWIADHKVNVVRVESSWGKYRIYDSRPTMGVLSELIHPLDLVQYLFDLAELKVVDALGVKSQYSKDGISRLDTVGIVLKSQHIPVVIRSSFVWPERHRSVAALLSAGEHEYMAVLQFDDPKWDCDQLIIYSIDKTDGLRHVIYQESYCNEDFPPNLFGIEKVKRFVESSLNQASGITSTVEIPGYTEAVQLQTLMNDVAKKIEDKESVASNFLAMQDACV